MSCCKQAQRSSTHCPRPTPIGCSPRCTRSSIPSRSRTPLPLVTCYALALRRAPHSPVPRSATISPRCSRSLRPPRTMRKAVRSKSPYQPVMPLKRPPLLQQHPSCPRRVACARCGCTRTIFARLSASATRATRAARTIAPSAARPTAALSVAIGTFASDALMRRPRQHRCTPPAVVMSFSTHRQSLALRRRCCLRAIPRLLIQRTSLQAALPRGQWGGWQAVHRRVCSSPRRCRRRLRRPSQCSAPCISCADAMTGAAQCMSWRYSCESGRPPRTSCAPPASSPGSRRT
mmetsp:Transcript_17719/g.35732  ORF Transcript_17719/g.35732 Transcript_17719/m.35732 type:complete len:290 (-) Transcript_17719:4206-5075(-)